MLKDANKLDVVNRYRLAGFAPFPLVSSSKVPPKDCVLHTADTTCEFFDDSNIGIFAASRNNLVVIDTDDDSSKVVVLNKLYNMGLLDWVTIVSTPNKNGYHFWIKTDAIPKTQAFYRLPDEIGSGEFRINRPSYVVAPPSAVPAGSYKFVQGGIESFIEQPVIPWAELTWLLPTNYFFGDNTSEKPIEYENTRVFRPAPPILSVLEELHNTPKGHGVTRINFRTGEKLTTLYKSRSEAEISVVISLLMSGWGFRDVAKAFETYKPGHYAASAKPYRYLVLTYNKAVQILQNRKTPSM